MALATVGAIVAANSLQHDIGWNVTGPGPGYFPFRVGGLIVLASLAVFLSASRHDSTETFVTPDGLRRSFSVFWPTAALAAAMFPLGCYVPSLAYLVWMMRIHGRWSWQRSAVVGAVIVVLIFLVFERWFQVPLAKGPLENLLGLY